MTDTKEDKETFVYRAKLAEQAERYDGTYLEKKDESFSRSRPCRKKIPMIKEALKFPSIS